MVTVRWLRMLERKKRRPHHKPTGGAEITHLHPPPFTPFALEFVEIAVEEHPAAGKPVLGHPLQGFAPQAPCSAVE